jgi:hypothetical protein
MAEYRLPLGVSGCSMAWHGDDILLIGGNRCGSHDGSTAVMMLDFQNKSILSLRDLNSKRSHAIIVSTAHDEMLAIAGAKNESSIELREWDADLLDYIWKDATSRVSGDLKEIMEKPTEYNAVRPTFCVSGSDLDNFPKFCTRSNFMFGNELSPFLMEFTQELEVKFYPAPMRLQQKTGQVAIRRSHNDIYFIGGTDTTYTFYSKKVFHFDITKKEVNQFGNLNVGRAGFCVSEFEVRIL